MAIAPITVLFNQVSKPLKNKGFPLISDKKICILTYKKSGCIIGIAVTKNIHPI
jgi:hypothetical protein